MWLHLAGVERQDEPLAHRRRAVLVALHQGLALLPHVAQVEHVVQVAVAVGDQVEDHVAVGLVGVDVVEDHQWVAVETGGDGLPRLLVNDVKQSLGGVNILFSLHHKHTAHFNRIL